ncbi:hypothetical protein [Paracidovorax avenae]|uniref:hypothetical protein n=1 Tax=Paracidovorax avenae TaxID=80867 RepID=UPI001AD842BD|nr:hypothetical protein [Paracidovorax avenae]
MSNKLPSAVFLSGKIVEKNVFIFSSRLDSLPDGEYHHARISGYKDGEFIFQDRDMQVVSVCVRRASAEEPLRASCLLPRFKSVVGFFQKGGDQYDEVLPESPGDGAGVMSQLRLIDGQLYAAGYGGCVFKRLSKSNWRVLSEGLNIEGSRENAGLSPAGSTGKSFKKTRINAINGGGGKIFCAGHQGEVFFLNDDKWVRVNSDTNAILYDIEIDGAGSVYISGKGGVLIKGDERGFKALHTGIDDYLVSMAFFDGVLYVGGTKGLYHLKNDVLYPVATNQRSSFNCVELDAYDGQLLVVSDRWFLVFDGKSWQRIDNPDNSDILKNQ